MSIIFMVISFVVLKISEKKTPFRKDFEILIKASFESTFFEVDQRG